MKHLFILILIFLTTNLSAKILISPFDAMKATYGEAVEVSKKNILLQNAQAEKINQDAKVKLDTNIFRVFKALKNNETVGYGILINRKVRSKNAVVLYMISKDSILKGIEIIAFNEPPEYIPSKTWIKQFDNISTDERLILSKDIPTITGATLSARSLVDSSRIAFALYNEMLKGK